MLRLDTSRQPNVTLLTGLQGGREKREKKAVNAPAGTRRRWGLGAQGGQGKVGALL